ncbi:MAG TPA: RNA polymerase sigma factor, partial [Kofleriaceae bacterium]|nr:RNA polymerase sigma factor [Kofleriaceae bacterium]
MTPPPPILDDLVARAVGGDAGALAAVCESLEAPVYRLALRMLGHRHDAEDAAQEILIKIVTSLASFEGRSALTTWVHRIAVRHILALKRRRSELQAVDEAALSARLEQGLAFGTGQPAPSPEDRTLTREIQLSCTQGMLMMLARDERLALVLVDLLGFAGAEAADIVEVSHDAFRQRLTRARAKLGEFLQARCGVANAAAACRCAGQVAAKRALGMTELRMSALSIANIETKVPDVVSVAQAELRHVRAIAAGFHEGGLLGA